MRRNRLLAGTLAAAALAAGCRREKPAETPVLAPPTLAAPAPSSATTTGLGAETQGYTNEMQAQNLREQAAELGIRRLAKPSTNGAEPEENRPAITYEEGLERTREYSREFEAQRHALERSKPKSVTLPTGTPGLLTGRKEGAPVEPAPETADPKGPEQK